MRSPPGFFCFEHLETMRDGDIHRLAFAYKQPGPLPVGILDELLVGICKGPNIPDAIVIVAVGGDAGPSILEELRSDISRLARQRIDGRIPLLLGTYDLRSGATRAVLLDSSFKRRKAALEGAAGKNVAGWLSSGVKSVFDASEVVLRAPSGYAYQKPSGARSEYFLKPDLALKSSANAAFVSLALFHRVFAARSSRFKDLQNVFLDTMGIAPVAYGLVDLLKLCGYGGALSIESFHSYGGFDEVKRPLPGTSLCIISASSSMALHERWMREKGVVESEVLTLLTLSCAEGRREGALLVVDPPGGATASGPAQLSIRISGETFLPEQEPAKKVLLSDVHHRSDEDVRLFCRLAGKQIFDVFRRPARSLSKVRALFVDGNKLLDEEEFDQWLHEQLLHSAKAASRVVVFQDDSASRALAERVKAYCEGTLGLSEMKLVSASRLALTKLKPDDGTIVCAAVVGKGSQLLEVSRALRDLHNGPRLYLIGFQVAETRGELKTLPANLRHSKTVSYDVARFGAAAIGTQLSSSFEKEMSTYYGKSQDLQRLPGALGQRGGVLGSTGEVAEMALLPAGDAVSGRLRLRAGFAYWAEDYSPQACQAEVLATIAVLLQRAREHDKLPDDRRLSTATYRQVMLDPENFTRFNDGVIQAALLRNAYPSELDYRSDHAASDFMKAVILRLLARATSEAGEAILEFLAALGLKRLQLADGHLAEVMAAAGARGERPLELHRAIIFLLGLKAGRGIAKQKLPF